MENYKKKCIHLLRQLKKLTTIQSKDVSAVYAMTVLGLVSLIIFTAFPHSVSKIANEEFSEVNAEGLSPSIAAATSSVLSSASNPLPTKKPEDEILAKADIVYDLSENKILFSKNAATPLPLASLTKIMTAITALDLAPQSSIITITKDALDQDGDSGLLLGERWSLDKILQFSLIVSSNDGAYAIASNVGTLLNPTFLTQATDTSARGIAAFVADMNRHTSTIGLVNSVFINPTGLDQSTGQAGAYGSAEDVAKMLMYGVNHYPDIFHVTAIPSITVSSVDGVSHVGQNTDILASKINNLIAGKTGYTDLAGGNLAVAFKNKEDHEIIVVVLGSTYDGRFDDVQKLINLYADSKDE